MLSKNLEEKRGELLSSYGNITVFSGFPHNFYEISKKQLAPQEESLCRAMLNAISGKSSLEEISRSYPKVPKAFVEGFNIKIVQEITMAAALDRFPSKQLFETLSSNLKQLLFQHLPSAKNQEEIVNAVLDHSVGYSFLAPLMRDAELEEIMVNSPHAPVFVFHRKSGMCKTNLSPEREDIMEKLIQKIANTIEKKFDVENPLLDARLPDGSRVNATSKSVSPTGMSLTIRKFTETPFSIIDLIEKNTLTSELAAFLWTMAEGLSIEPMNMIVTGGSGSGKTTTLNALANFVRYSDRVVSIEDTLELDLGSRENIVRMESKPATGNSAAVSMDELLKNSLRMRPDRIIVGEVRGEEAQTLFVAMDTGHQGCMGTLHSNSAREMLLRLQSKPMSVPESMLNLLDLIIVQYRMYSKATGPMRRIVQVAELSRMDEKVLLSNVFEWDRKKDLVVRTDVPSHIIEYLAEKTSMAKNDLKREMLIRQRILEWMQRKQIRKTNDVEKIIQQYYLDPNSVLEEVMKGA